MDFIETIKIIPAAIIGLTVHEFAHAYTAYRLGDTTAKDMGRVTLNPLKHIDWMGFFLIIIAGFGWAKPVMFDPEKLKNKHRDEILISIAGPISNLLLAILFFLLARVLITIPAINGTQLGVEAINLIFIWGYINIGLFVFNLIPLPPLDGSHIYLTYLKDTNPKLMANLYKYGTLGLLVIIIAESQLKINILHLGEIINAVVSFIINLLKV